jgi:hypothetical protein
MIPQREIPAIVRMLLVRETMLVGEDENSHVIEFQN